MAFKRDGQRRPAPIWLIVQGAFLAGTGCLAAVGMTFVCVVRNALQPHDPAFRMAQDMPMYIYAAFFAVMLAWGFFATWFSWRNRTWLGLSLSAIAFGIFAFSAANVLKFAYPVCNAF